MENVTNQILEGNQSIIGLMVESHLSAGNQKIPNDLKELEYGVSITDACIDWETTETSILAMHEKLVSILPDR
jgi:3-deoxy-7-phosphoheptulonate synthase